MSGEGMVAVVQSLRDAGLAVTVMDGNRNKFSLVPNTAETQLQPQHSQQYPHMKIHLHNSAAETDSTSFRRDSSAQATDGRYASMYQTTHGNVEPTSPPCEVTEFPPQRAELCPGHGNFEVGGLGSGETGRVPIKPHQGNYRGGLSWVDRGSVCQPRSSRQVDAFANSLRKYPTVSPDRSAEVLERLVNYSQTKNLSRHSGKVSPPRASVESEVSHQTYVERSPRRARYDEARSRTRVDEYPTRDGRPRKEEYERRNYIRNNDRYEREVIRAKDSGRLNDYNYQCYGDDYNMPSSHRRFIGNGSTNSVHTETQAVTMCSKEVATVPRCTPMKINVAVPQSASASTVGHPEGAVSDLPSTRQVEQNATKIISFKSVQTTSSTMELTSTQKNLNPRKSKSEDDLKRQHFQERIIELIGSMAVNAKAKDNVMSENILKDMWIKLHRVLENVEKQNSREKALIHLGKKMRKTPIYIPIRYEAIKDCTRTKIRKWTEMDVYHAALPPFKMANVEDRFEDIVKDWVNSLPINGKSVDIIKISDALVRELLTLLTAKTKLNCESLKKQIVHLINQAPIEVQGNRNVIKLSVNELVSELENIAPNMFIKQSKIKPITLKSHMHPSEENIKELVSNVIAEFIEKHNLEITRKDINEMKIELTEILINFIYEGTFVSEKDIKEDIMSLLSDYNIQDNQSKYLANTLLNKLKQTSCSKTKYDNKNLTVCFSTSIKRNPAPILNASENFDAFKDNLCKQIDEWLTDLPEGCLKLTSKDARETLINELAAEIVDRQKYLEFNSSKTNDENELEYLKYQIYKWINKVVGEENINIVEYASDLMKKIRQIPMSQFLLTTNVLNVDVRNTFPNSTESTNPNYLDVNISNNSKRRTLILKTSVKNQTDREQKESCSQCTQKSQSRITVQSLNDEYDEYVKNWVKQIPIPASSPQEKELSEKLRVGLHNGIWKALTKLKFDPVTFHNSFYYQDLLDDEIESLLNSLPKSEELDSKKYVMKAQLLEHTSNTNEKLMKLAEPASYKQTLLDNVANHVPRSNNDDNDPIKMHEDLQILSIVEDYILLTNYDEDNKVKANAFRRKLLKNVEAFVEELKKTHGKELKDIDIGIYMNDIIEALHNVPLPSEDSLKEEADEIILGTEIEHWFNDLPLVPNDDYFEQLQRRRLRDSLTKKIIDIEKSNNACAAENAQKREVTKFLQSIPLIEEEATNINIFSEELMNRIKNKKREQSRRRSVVFQQPVSYQEFKYSKELPHCSSLLSGQSKLSHSLPGAPSNYHSAIHQNNNTSLQQPAPYQEFKFNRELPNISSFSGDKSFSYIPSAPQYHPTPKLNHNLNNTSLIGGGMLYNPPAMNNTINASHDYHTFEGNRPLSSSLYSLPPNIYGNTQNPSRAEPQWLNLEEQSQFPRPHTAASYLPESAWVSLEQVPMPEELRREIHVGAPIPQQMKSFVYSDSQSIHQSLDQRTMQGSCCAKNKTHNADALPQVIQDQILRINEAAVGHINSPSQNNNACLAANVNQVPAERSIVQTNNDLNGLNANIRSIIKPVSQTRESFNRSRASRNNDIERSIMQPNEMYNNQSMNHRSNEAFDQNIRSVRAVTPTAQIQQHLSNRTQEGSLTQYSHLPAQNIPEMISSEPIEKPSQNINIPSVHSSQHSQQIPVPNIPVISEPQQVDQEQNQVPPSGSTYGQPQGFSTPHQEINQRSPPRIRRKKHDPLRFRSGPARRRLELDDSDDSEEDCPCMNHLKGRPCGELDYPCFYPFPYPYPYFF